MLQRKFRLPRAVRFSNASLIHTPYFFVKYQLNHLDYPRLSFVVSKKIDKRAVVRNSLKRKLRSCFEEQGIEKVKGWDMVVVVKTQARDVTRDMLCSEVEKVVEKLSR